MANVPFNSNSSVLSVIKETEKGKAPDAGKALILQPNSIDSFGNSIETAARAPISTSRDAKKGTVVNLSSSVEAPQDLTISAYRFFSEGAMCSTYEGMPSYVIENAKMTATGIEVPLYSFDVSNVKHVITSGFKKTDNNGQFAISANSNGKFITTGLTPEPAVTAKIAFWYKDITAASINADGKIEYTDSAKILIGSSITLSGYTETANNGTFKVTDNADGLITLDTALTAEATPDAAAKAEATYEVTADFTPETDGFRYALPSIKKGAIILFRGYQNAANNGIKVITDITNGVAALQSEKPLVEEIPTKATGIFVGYQFPAGELTLNEQGALVASGTSVGIFSALKLQEGMGIWIGGLKDEYHFNDRNTTTNAFTHANGLARVAGITDTVLSLDKREDVYAHDTAADYSAKTIRLFIGEFIRTRAVGSAGYQEPTYTFELKTTNEDNENFYEYSVGNQINSMELGLSPNAMGSMALTTVGQRTEDATVTPKEWTREEPALQEAFSTPSDVLRLRVQKADETGLMSIFTNATLAINNNIGTESVIGMLGAYRTSLGQFAVTLTGTAVFMSTEVARAITNNCSVSADFLMENNDGAIYVDIPNMTLSDGSRDFTVNEKIKQNITGTAFADEKTKYNYSISSTIFYWLPTNKAEVC